MENTNTPVQLKSAIIGKMWSNKDTVSMVPASYTLPQDMAFGANESYLIGDLSFRTDRNLNASPEAGVVSPVVLKAGSKLFFYSNPKRTEADPDYSVSVVLPVDVAMTVIANSKAGIEAWKLAQVATA